MKLWMIALVISLIAIWAAWAAQSWLLAGLTSEFPDLADRGAWGDSFGALNALLSAFAFVGVVITLWQQQKQITEARADIHRQRFENTFFELLKMIREAREEVRFRYSDDYLSGISVKNITKQGNDAFRSAYRELRYWTNRADANDILIDRSLLSEFYSGKIHNRYESTLGAYYRLVYGILDRVRNDPRLTESEKDAYGNLVRSQFTSFEALLAGFNGLNAVSKDFDAIIIRFRLLKYARRGMLYDHLRRIYPREAFLGRDEQETVLAEEPDDHEDE